MDEASTSRTVGRALSAFALVALPIISIAGQIPRLPDSHPELQQITFSPQLTPINFTVTPQSTAIAPVGAQVLAPGSSGAGEEGDELNISGGDWIVGYDLVQTPNGPQWHLWLNGEVIIVEPNDPAVTSLITAFMISAENRARADAELSSAGSTQNLALAGAGAGAVSFVGGTATAVVGCAGIPFTFWAAGGTGWACAGGVVAAVGGLGAIAVSVVQIFQSESDKDDAAARYETASQSAEGLFEALKDAP